MKSSLKIKVSAKFQSTQGGMDKENEKPSLDVEKWFVILKLNLHEVGALNEVLIRSEPVDYR